MTSIIIRSFMVLLAMTSFTAAAQLYKGFDAEGNVVYSDKPFANAENYELPPILVITPPTADAEEAPVEQKKAAGFKYMQFDILSPKHNETIQNSSEIVVSLNLKPGLNTQENHSIWMLVDGKPVVKNSQSLSFPMGQIESGVYNIQAQIRDESGKTVLRTRTNLVFIQ